MATINNVDIIKNLEVNEITSPSQTLITLTEIVLDVSSGNVPTVFVDGSFETDFTVESSTTVRLNSTFPVGTQIYVLQYSIE